MLAIPGIAKVTEQAAMFAWGLAAADLLIPVLHGRPEY